MARHRHVQNLNYDEEYDAAHDDSVYGHSVEEYEYGISPSVESYLSHNKGTYGIGDYFGGEKIREENEENSDDQHSEGRTQRRDSNNFERPRLSSEDEVRLNSILDELRNVVGDAFSDAELIQTVLYNNYQFETSLDALLNQNIKPEPSMSRPSPRTPRPDKEKNVLPETRTPVTTPFRTPPRVVLGTPLRSVKGFSPQVNGASETTSDEEAKENIQVSCLSDEKEASTNARPPAKLRDKEVDIAKKFKECRGGNRKELLNMVVIGHVDAGKSTMMGHLLYLQGSVSQRTMHKYEQESKKMNKSSFMYAWVLDDTEEERSRGVTVDVAQRSFETDKKTITLLDAPGHRDFIPNMITGAARADVAVLVVDATTGGFEAGFESGGQTREHAILIRSLGLSQLAVAVNKMDMVDWQESRFQEIKSNLSHFLKTVGFRDADVIYVPCSGLTGENLCKSSKIKALTAWYHGDTLMQTIDKLKAPERGITRPIRFCINDLYKGQGASMCVAGRLETGYIQNGDRLLLMPQGEVLTVKGVETDSGGQGFSFAGDHIILNVSGVDPSALHIGDFLCDPVNPIKQANRIQARVVVFNILMPIIKGAQLDFHYQSVTEGARVRKLVSLLHKSTGQVLKQRPRAVTKNTSALIELEFSRPLCLEEFRNFKELGRFMLRNNGVTVAAGMVTQILA